MSEGQYQRQHEQHCGNNNKFHGATLTGKISGNLGHWYCGIYVHRKWCTSSHFRTVESYKTQSKGRGRNTCECCWCYRYRWMIYVGVRSLILFCSVRYQYWYRWRWVWLGFDFACCESASCFHSRSTCCYRIVFLFFSFFADHYFLIDAVFECIFRLSASCFFMNGAVLKVDFFIPPPNRFLNFERCCGRLWLQSFIVFTATISAQNAAKIWKECESYRKLTSPIDKHAIKINSRCDFISFQGDIPGSNFKEVKNKILVNLI